MPMPNKKSLCKRKKFSFEEFFNSIVLTNYYKKIKTTPIHECLRLVAFNYFNVSIYQRKEKKVYILGEKFVDNVFQDIKMK